MDILDLLLDDDPPTAKPAAVTTPAEDVENDVDLLLEEYHSSTDLEAKKASLRTLISLIKRT